MQLKISAVIAPKKLKNDFKNPGIVFSFAAIALGLIFGSVLYIFSKNYTYDTLFEYFIRFSTEFSYKNKPEIFSGLIVSNILYVILMLVFGMGALSSPVIFLLSFIKSAGLGMTVTHIFNTYALEGIEYCMLVYFPGKALLLFSMLLLTQSCYWSSREISRAIKGEDVIVRTDKYILRSVLICLVFVIASLIEFITIICFSSLFSFS